MKEKVWKVIEEHRLIEEGDNIVIGLSGGPDSIALLYVLLEIKEYMDFNIFIAHVNHGVRGKDALEDEKFVQSLSSKLHLPYYCRTVNMDEYAREKRISSEEAGREIRYSFFREILSKIGGGKIAVAHNKDDQAETLIMRFFRGTGIDGLKGMEYKINDIIRPVLGIERKEIENYLLSRNISSRLDKTNLEPIYSRNRIRLELMPYIRKNYNPNIVDTLWRTSEIASMDSDFLDQYTENAYRRMVKKRKKHSIVLDSILFKKEHISIQHRILRNCILHINHDLQGFTKTHITSILRLFLEGGTGKKVDLINDIEARINYKGLVIEKKHGNENKDFLYKLNIEGNTYIKELGFEIKTEILSLDKVDINTKNRFIKYFDYDKLQGKLYARNRKAGDRFVPFGMNGSKKIKDYFIDEKIPKEERDKIPLITDEKNIIWISGYRISDLYKITESTNNVLKISIIKN